MEKLFKDRLICAECGKEFEQRIPTHIPITKGINYCSECCQKKGLCLVCQEQGIHLH